MRGDDLRIDVLVVEAGVKRGFAHAHGAGDGEVLAARAAGLGCSLENRTLLLE